jgi:osmotically-inducible protein OsmY
MVNQVSSARESSDAIGEQTPLAARRVSGDEEITQAMLRKVKALGYAGLQPLTCEHHEGMLVLRGQVPSYFMKQLAQELASKIPGVKLVVNSLSVETTKQLEQKTCKPDSRREEDAGFESR